MLIKLSLEVCVFCISIDYEKRLLSKAIQAFPKRLRIDYGHTTLFKKCFFYPCRRGILYKSHGKASRRVIMAFMRDFHKTPARPSSDLLDDTTETAPTRTPISGLLNVKVLLVSDDIHSRYYPFWASRAIDQKEDLSKDIDDSLFSEENIDQSVGCIF